MIIVDTDIIIKVFRGNTIFANQLRKLDGEFAISVVTAFELYNGVNSANRLFELNKQLKTYTIIHLSENISEKALLLYRIYKAKEDLLIADTLIAATAIVNDFELFTDNKKDYSFIKGLKFYHPK